MRSHQHDNDIKAMNLDEIIQGEKVDTEEGTSASWKARILIGWIHVYSLTHSPGTEWPLNKLLMTTGLILGLAIMRN